ncbi:MAG: CDP-glycerol glycerophosphotransferase family protein [Turicibacter sp.]|nr:CDP-glycerol glycerophosphotransferase family protein [Turicibacter sp.]
MGKLLFWMKVGVEKKCYQFIYILCLLKQPDEDKLTLATNRTHELSGNLQNIYGELIKTGENVKIHVLTKKSPFRDNLELLKAMATSKIVVIDDYFLPIYLIPKKWQRAKVVQVWHAIGNFKKVGRLLFGSASGVSLEYSKMVNIHSNYDVMCVGSEAEKKMYQESFFIGHENFAVTGIPKTDIYFKQRDFTHLSGKKPIAVYAPTYRGNPKDDVSIVMGFLEKFAKGEAVFEWHVSLHPYVADNKQIGDYVAKHPRIKIIPQGEVEMVLLASELLVSDYSAIILEYLALEKPLFLYAPDYETYKKSRGFYHDYVQELKGALVSTREEMAKKMETYDFATLRRLGNLLFPFTDGNSTWRVAQLILKLLRRG